MDLKKQINADLDERIVKNMLGKDTKITTLSQISGVKGNKCCKK